MIIKPPTYHPLLNENGTVNSEWLLFFQNVSTGDKGASWTPAFTSLTEVGGAATKTGVFFRISSKLIYFRAVVTPVTNTSATAGTTYIGTLPFTIATNGSCLASSTTAGSAGGSVVSSTNRIYVPGWVTITTPVYITGVIEAA